MSVRRPVRSPVRTPDRSSVRPAVRRSLAAGAAAALSLSLTTTLAPAGANAAEESTGTAEPAATSGSTEAAAAPGAIAVDLKVARQERRTVRTSRSYARGLLRDEGVSLGRRDLVRVVRDGRRVRPAGARELQPGDTVRVVRVDVRTQKRRVRVAPPTRTRTVDRLRPGVRRVVRDGRPGVRLVRVTRTLHNWRAVDRDVRRSMVRSPRPRVVHVGRRERSVAGADGLRWGALANCESSGNPRAVNPAGYYGLYQFNVPTWGTVGGRGMPHQASAAEQTYRAKLLYRQRGRSPWPHCGRLL
ncbi:transglycosylase family protein [Nocardioides sp. SYSU DS0663]|uniref:resuscitation-promoting factor n=1 Tax=Nocardioides sp. SYSU DS0663 TaxID=3416445 RepID=UPI003F4BB9D7